MKADMIIVLGDSTKKQWLVKGKLDAFHGTFLYNCNSRNRRVPNRGSYAKSIINVANWKITPFASTFPFQFSEIWW